MSSSEVWGEDIASRYDTDAAGDFAPAVLDPAVDYLHRLAEGGPVLEFAIGTGRVAIPLVRRGVRVTGIELSEPMVARLRAKIPQAELPVVVGDMATTIASGAGGFTLVYLVANTIANLRTQPEQVQCFRNAAAHLRPGGRFVIELWVPPVHRLAPGETAVPMVVEDGHLVVDTYDLASQESTSHHYRRDAAGTVHYSAGRFRYLWPAECDLMAQLAGLDLETRMADWAGTGFDARSTSHVSIWRKPA